MALHFERAEYARRQAALVKALAENGLDGLLIFRQESMYYLTGYDTSGYSLFQCLYFSADGATALLTRSADRLQARITSTIEDIRIWVDGVGAQPGMDLRSMLESYGCRGKRLGAEYDAYGLTAARGKMVDGALEGFCSLTEATHIVRGLRLRKSAAEIECFRKAGALADGALAISVEKAVPGAHTGMIYGEMIRSVMAGDGDPSASRWPLGAGEAALLVRYHTGHETIGERDQVQFEIAAPYRHYHSALMYVVVTGNVDPRHRAMFAACRDALARCQSVARPGATVGDIFQAHASSLTEAGYEKCFLNACGYTMNASYPPTWMDTPMIDRGNPLILEPDMIFFMHMIMLDADTGLSMSLGETVRITSGACERLTHAPADLISN